MYLKSLKNLQQPVEYGGQIVLALAAYLLLPGSVADQSALDVLNRLNLAVWIRVMFGCRPWRELNVESRVRRGVSRQA